MTIGEKIAKSRRNMNLTQDQLAELLEVTRQTISKWESDLAFPETAKIAKLAGILNVTCDYLLKEDEPAVVGVSMSDEGGYALDWTKLYPVLAEYENIVNCSEYYEIFAEMMKGMMRAYNYSLEDSMLVLKDLFYKAYLQMQREEK